MASHDLIKKYEDGTALVYCPAAQDDAATRVYNGIHHCECCGDVVNPAVEPIEVVGLDVLRAALDEAPAGPCEWFALCDHPADRYRPHPILGQVPICARCAEKLSAMGA
ncbi:hypothetical protein [Parafrankia discariae]|uniref:hypothetical protein n=1 Tax=Parafrankia discariae TaxID=365528 RepID=UPI00037E7645|nr:hypothetical protein [Parafrankia discariae]